MAKLGDFLNKVLLKTGANINNTPLGSNVNSAVNNVVNNNLSEQAAKAMLEVANDFKKIQREIIRNNNNELYIKQKIDQENIKLLNAKKTGDITEVRRAINLLRTYDNKLANIDLKAKRLVADSTYLFEDIGRKNKLSQIEISKIMANMNNTHRKNIYNLIDANEEFLNSIKKNNELKEKSDKLIAGGFHNAMSNVKVFFKEFGFAGELIGGTLVVMEGLNKKMIQFNRKMSLGFSSENLGMDLYGNSGRGSIRSIAGGNFLSDDEFLNSFAGLNKGKVLGKLENNTRVEDMQNFGITSGQLSKFYGVDQGVINSITSNLVYNYGVKIKELNEIFRNGEEAALGAGLSVQNYFKNLQDASSQIGQHYISDGVKGLEKLALYASKTDQSINSIMKNSDRFEHYGSLYMQQNMAAAHGLNLVAKNTAKIWALDFTGRQVESDQLFKESIAKDVMNNGWVDKNNGIDQIGLRNLKQLGYSQEEINNVSKLIKIQKELGISTEQYYNVQNESLDIQKKVNKFNYANLTFGEKLEGLWKKISGTIIDPFIRVFGPMFDILVNTIGGIIDFITPIVKIVFIPIERFGKALGWLSDIIQDIILWFKSSPLGKFWDWGNKTIGDINSTSSVGGGIFDTIAVPLGAVMSYKILGKLGLNNSTNYANIGRIVGESKIGRIIGNAGTSAKSFVNDKGSSLLDFGIKNNMSPAGFAKGLGVSAGVGIGGAILGSYVGERNEKAGDTISSISEFAGLGGTIGTFFGPIGTAVGLGIGAIIGLVKDSWNDIDKVWEDGSHSLWASIEHHSENMWDGLTQWYIHLFEGNDDKPIADIVKTIVKDTSQQDLAAMYKKNKDNAINLTNSKGNFNPMSAYDPHQPKDMTVYVQHVDSDGNKGPKKQAKAIQKTQ